MEKTYYLNLQDRLTRANIWSAKPTKEFRVSLKEEGDPSAAPVIGRGKLAADGESLGIHFEGQDSGEWELSVLKASL